MLCCVVLCCVSFLVRVGRENPAGWLGDDAVSVSSEDATFFKYSVSFSHFTDQDANGIAFADGGEDEEPFSLAWILDADD